MRKFEFSEFDAIGEETLEAIGKAEKFNRWMYQTIKPWCKGEVLEIGSGAGNISQFFLEDGFYLTLTDIRKSYCRKLETKFSDSSSLRGVEKMDLVDPDFEKTHAGILGTFDTVFALNVVEHIEDDMLAVKNCRKLLKPGGNLIILVPSFGWMYNRFDVGLGHYRRYTKKSLSRLFGKSGFQILHRQYFNFTGLFGWFFSGKILQRKVIPTGQVSLFNHLIPVVKLLDNLTFRSAGLSTIVVGKKNNQ